MKELFADILERNLVSIVKTIRRHQSWDMTLTDVWLLWDFGRPVEPLEPEDFGRNGEETEGERRW